MGLDAATKAEMKDTVEALKKIPLAPE